MSTQKIAILAGNPRVGLDKNGGLLIDPQLEAFEEALKIAADCRDQIAKIVVLFDHRRGFKKRFVDETLEFASKKQKKKAFDHLKMSHLLPEIRNVYEGLAQKYGVALDQINVLSEDMCRLEIFKRMEGNQELKKFATNKREQVCTGEKSCSVGGSCGSSDWEEDVDDQEVPELRPERVSCPGIAAAAISYLAKGLNQDDKIITCWQYDQNRVNSRNVIVGSQIARNLLGVENPIEVRYVRWPVAADGTVASETIVKNI